MAKGNTNYLTLDGISAIEGGVSIIQDGKIIGAIGVSDASSAQDGQIAQANISTYSPSLVLLGSGLAGLAAIRRRFKR